MNTTADGSDGVAAAVARGVAAGLGGSLVMTAFQRLVEMPITGRGESYAPATFLETVLPLKPKTRPRRRALNYVGHFTVGASWGAGHGVAEHLGLRGQRAIGTVFGALYLGDLLFNSAIGVYQPWRWSARDWAIDVGEKLLLGEATGLIYERLPAGGD